MNSTLEIEELDDDQFVLNIPLESRKRKSKIKTFTQSNSQTEETLYNTFELEKYAQALSKIETRQGNKIKKELDKMIKKFKQEKKMPLESNGK